MALLFGGVLTTGLGLACSVLPGVVLVLLAWVVVQRDLDRVESGFLPVVERPGLQVVRAFVVMAVVGAALVACVQLWLTWNGFYDVFWPAALAALVGAR